MHRILAVVLLSWFTCAPPRAIADEPAAEAPAFRVGFAEQDITPPAGLPMWGYGARHALPAQGTLDPLMARAVVVQAGEDKLAIVGMDLGRGPTAAMMDEIRAALHEKAGIDQMFIAGSHTHHGPVIELTDRDGYGKGHFDEAVAYAQSLPGRIVEVILKADTAARPARIGVASRNDLTLNRNRQTKREPKATDPTLGVIRFDDVEGKPIAVVVNFTGHPVMTDALILKFSADYPGHMCRKVSEELQCGCVFMQGASGDLSVNAPEGVKGPQAFGELLAGYVVELAKGAETSVPATPSIAGRTEEFLFESRVDFDDPLTNVKYSLAFFPDLIRNFMEQFKDGVPAELNTVLLNGQIALVGGSGEFFCNHANRLRERAYVDHTLFFGYCNGHSLYFPTIEAVSEGGYGADKEVSPVAVGAGEQMMNRALQTIYELQGKLETMSAEK